MKRKYRKNDTVKIGKFGLLSTFGRYENQRGKITKCLNKKQMGFWVYEVELHGFKTEKFTEKYILRR
jgi:phage regulator Rha-like protein